MAATLAGLVREWQRVKTEFMAAAPEQSLDLHQYATDPVGYANNILGVGLTPDQEIILRHLLIPPCMVDVPSGNSTGKSFVAAVALCWWFDCVPGSVVYSTAPRYEHVVTVLWGLVRLLRARARERLHSPWVGPKAPELYDGPDHFAVGLTAAKGESWQGRHIGRKLFIFDEATGLPAIYFQSMRTMLDPATGDAALMIYNPMDSTSPCYVEDMIAQDADEKVWHRIRLQALDHPNVVAELKGEPAPFKGAVNLKQLEGWFRDWCEVVEDVGDIRATDVLWPPAWTQKPGKWYRPGPEFQVRAMGLWPDTGQGVWSDSLWAACERRELPWNLALLPQVGCDTAMGKGDDWHAIHAQWGGVSLPEGHQTANTMDPVRIAGKLRDMAAHAARFATSKRDPKAAPIEPKRVPIAIDDDGTGNAIWAFLAREGWNIRAVGAGCASSQPQRYRRRRDELWFSTAEKARRGGVSFALLDKATQRRLKQQLLAPAWDMDGSGRRCVEEKDKTKEKLGRSPDDADATNLAFLEVGATAPSVVELPEDTEYKGGHYGMRRQPNRW